MSSRRSPITTSAIFLLFCSLFSVTALHPSPKADADLICHTKHASECYPRMFQPTDSFQIVHDDQNLPPGLHIRMNLATGVKEAKLNEPDEENLGHAADLVIIDDVPSEAHISQDQPMPRHAAAPKLQDQTRPQLSHPPRPLPPHFDSSEGALFASRVSTLKSSAPSDADTLIPALSDLQDLAHSSHWGLTLTRDSTICHLLLQLLSPSSILFASTDELRSTAALLLGTAIHNNPDALTAALSHFYNDEWPSGPLEAVILALVHEQLSSISTRMVFLLSGLCQDEKQMLKFINGGGLDLLTRLFNVENAGADERDRLRGKIANFILDNFLQIDETANESKNIKKELKTDSSSGEFQSRLENEDAWIKVEKEDEKQVTHADLKASCAEQKRTLSQWCSLFETSLAKLKAKSEMDSTTEIAIESIRDAQLALENKLGGCGCDCRYVQHNSQ